MHYLLLASVLWGTSFIAGKYAESFATPEIVVLFRLALAGLFVAHIAIPTLKKLDKKLFKQILLVSFLTFPATFLLQFIGLEYTTATNAITMLGFLPLIVLIAGHLFFNEKANIKQLALGGLAFIGVLLVMGKPDLSNDNFVGCALVLSSCLVVAIWIQLSKVLMHKVPRGSYTPLTLFLGAILTLPCTALLTDSWELTPSVTGISAVLYLGIACNLVASWAWNKGVSMTDTHVSGFFLALEPVFGVLFGILLMGDRPNFYASIGIGLVLFSVMYSVRVNKKS